MKVPTSAATMPTTMVSSRPMRWRPGTTRRPRTPMTMPMTIALMIPDISMGHASRFRRAVPAADRR
ncbi:hypothetical protein [Streptomyces diastaticus]|uniref:hypothetical protein n=1 Tax=Streptomyces diastaticus TaxID=1956 RepID=UPI00381FB017